MGDSLVIGLNPPYGVNNSLAAKFQEQAVKFRPRIIVLIVPPATPVSLLDLKPILKVSALWCMPANLKQHNSIRHKCPPEYSVRGVC